MKLAYNYAAPFMACFLIGGAWREEIKLNHFDTVSQCCECEEMCQAA
jgi:hypothetical protein